MDVALATVAIASDRAWQVRHGNALLRFGIGPPRAAGADPARADAVTSGAGWSVAWARQVHGNLVQLVDHPRANPVGDCDGLVTRRRRHALLVWTADCVPVLLAAPTAVAAVHAGWRGVAAGIVEQALIMLEQECDTAPSLVTAWLGPAVCGDHYPVGDEVRRAIAATGIPAAAWSHGSGVDLRDALTEQLATAGVSRDAIHRVPACTVADPRLASYRRDAAGAGRQWSLAVLT